MANCKDNCIHYKVCMYKDLSEYKTEQILKDDCDYFMPKDVVPKSEYDRVRFNLKAVLDEIPETKQEVAREIFEEIERNFVSIDDVDFNRFRCIGARTFAELRKKYTENEDTK